MAISKSAKNLVLLWGWSRTEKSYQKLVDFAPENWKIYHISYPELMPSGRVEELRETLSSFLRKNNLNKVYLMGHSLGGALALEFAYHHPEHVIRLFLIDASGIVDGRSAFRALLNIILRSGRRRERWSLAVHDITRSFSHPLLHVKLGRHAHYRDLQKEAAKLKVPTLIFWGREDRIKPLSHGQKLHQLIPDSKLIIIEDEGHDWIIHSPELFWKHIN